LVEKACELGVATFIPLVVERTKREASAAEHARWQRLSIAASKQCLRLHSMTVAAPTPLAELLPRIRTTQTLLAVQGGAPFAGLSLDRSGGLILVGPPGDFTSAEKDALTQAGATGVGLGNLRLRTETAALSLAVVCQLMHGVE
jgi:16S rRNA (uracil1498-N3)-methyltransferase